MARADRLFLLLQALRRRRVLVGGPELATELGISLRTLYRDIATLRDLGARIDGEPGIGYRMQPGFLLPPLMFSIDELEALMLGARWVARSDDPVLVDAARDAITRIRAVLPDRLREEFDATTLFVGPRRAAADALVDAAQAGLMSIRLREAMRGERRVWLRYRDEKGQSSERRCWPIAIGFFETTRIVVGWCELREDYRHFRLDRILDCRIEDSRYPRRRLVLLAEWRERQGIPSPATDRI